MSKELKGYPWCGGTVRLDKQAGINDGGCWCSITMFMSFLKGEMEIMKDKLIQRWNTRYEIRRCYPKVERDKEWYCND